MKVIISAAGTGGHINPGIAIANKIKEHEPDSEIVFFGTTRGLENDLVPRAGFELKTIEAYGIQPKPSIQNIKNIIKTMNSRKVVKKFIDEFKPDIVIGTGGYICGPVFAAANAKKVPTFLHESNAYPGRAVKMFAKKAKKVFVGFEAAKEKLSGTCSVVVTGTPTKIKKVDIKRICNMMHLSTHWNEYYNNAFITAMLNKEWDDAKLTAAYVRSIYNDNLLDGDVKELAKEAYENIKSLRKVVDEYSDIFIGLSDKTSSMNIQNDEITSKIYTYILSQHKKQKVVINGVEYTSVKDAMTKLGKSKVWVSRHKD